MKKIIFASVFLMGLTAGVIQAKEEKAGHIMVVPEEMSWKPGPGSIPSGAEYAVIEGNPKEEGLFTMRLRLPVDYKIGSRHYAFTKNEPAIIQLHGIGPWGINYVNPKDDPRKQTRR